MHTLKKYLVCNLKNGDTFYYPLKMQLLKLAVYKSIAVGYFTGTGIANALCPPYTLAPTAVF
jgi:hypothetical protein